MTLPTKIDLSHEIGLLYPDVPLGVSEAGVVTWDPEAEPHMLLAGRTRTGKTALARTIVTGLGRIGASMVLVDPKRVGLVDLQDVPGVLAHRTTADVPALDAALEWVETEMYARYDQIARGVPRESFSRLVVVVDEGRALFEMTKVFWNTVQKPSLRKIGQRPVGSEHPCMERIRSLLRLGGEARISVVLISQQADASWLSTEARQNLGVRIGLGAMDDDGKGMLFGRRTRLAPLPTNPDGTAIKGRAYFATVGSAPVEMQAFWTEPPLPPLTLAQPSPKKVSWLQRLFA